MLILSGLLIYQVILVFVSNLFPKKKFFDFLKLALFIVPLICLCSFKGMNVGLDTDNYYDIYNNIFVYKAPTEIGFCLLMKVFKGLNLPFFVFLLFISTVTFISSAIFCYKKTSNPILTLFFLTFFGLFGFALSGIRQAFAIGIVLLGFSFYRSDKPISLISPVIAIAIAFFFHRTSLVALVIPVFLLFDIKKNAFIYIVLTCLLIGLIGPLFYSYYVIQNTSILYPSKEGTYFTLIIYALFAILLFILSRSRFSEFEQKIMGNINDKIKDKFSLFELEKEDGDFLLSYKTVTCYIVFPILILLLSVYSAVFARINYYFIAFTGVILVNTFNSKKLLKPTRYLLDILLVLFLCIYFIYSVMVKNPLHVSDYSFGPIF